MTFKVTYIDHKGDTKYEVTGDLVSALNEIIPAVKQITEITIEVQTTIKITSDLT